ncbi:MAG: protein-export membrane protein SecD [Candidatus Kerfeldbacteria bacterium RIFCSPLOWO2_01_FULL_48_11]|uniref:Protein translocase subunit SecD n=1 Tax=Candidatus Kerfeldbacteria bacterium RIFCSPLOWO2_01_FULL_48_11 TaxID=1798543 RepID=A0A1G2B0N7_9BACT|nr:MAG: Protein translocase subunit SecD [Parcubacteria group bacterium GW2011_GWA2_48_9]KKW16338.1 MAG: Protein translocase subunit SecD [Parcubacteria group bacterium GW2011_GWC2_49_9]OGY82753.1 MAG: protein-export membrane protein SecD [Candidatus Kerfeldbacteria bacterium RIFCSPLOWO2_01_FULL_48_11]HCJ52632.1 protein translocase subunit SecD [Candidatus Kerfeldbacteria bacterium]
MRRKFWITFLGILLLAVVVGLVDYPSGPNIGSGEVKVHLGLDLKGGVQLVYSADTSGVSAGEEVDAVEGVRDVVERRVNAFGVSEPVVQTNKTANDWRLIVELAGVTDIDQAIATIGETPLLEFYEQQATEITDEQRQAFDAYNTSQRKKAEGVLAEALAPDADFGALADKYSEDPGNNGASVDEKKGGDLGYARRGQFVPEFEAALFDQLAVGEVTPSLVDSQFGYHIIKKEDQRTVDENGESIIEVRGRHILFATQTEENAAQPQFAPTGLSGQQLERASVLFEPNTNTPYVSLQFNSEGSKLFEEITTRNVNKPIAIYLDGAPISAPVVQEKIVGGQASIEGSFTLDEAKQLAQRLNAGALPIPITLISQQAVGATLGKESVHRSFFAGLLGIAIVSLFMIVYYRYPGLLSVFALCLYALITLALFKLIPVTLTLAGVAGFILSIGMAVDANVLIFERIREELHVGKNLQQAIEEGFKRAWPSIRDSNVSSLITVAILAWFGSSIIQGFAITLGIGILVSMFSAITVTRTFLRISSGAWLEKRLGLVARMRDPISH